MAFVSAAPLRSALFRSNLQFRSPICSSSSSAFVHRRPRTSPSPSPSSIRMASTDDTSSSTPTPTPTPDVDMSKPTIFDKIIAGEIPADVVYEDEEVVAFRDINPQAPVHVLVIPRRRIATMASAELADKATLGHLMLAAAKVARLEGLADDGYRLIINSGPNGLQSVYHLHVHVIGGRKLKWGPF